MHRPSKFSKYHRKEDPRKRGGRDSPPSPPGSGINKGVKYPHMGVYFIAFFIYLFILIYIHQSKREEVIDF